MLSRLRLGQFALVEQLEIDLCGGLNVFTGDTGAGKSIIVNAIALLGGFRADSGWVRSGSGSAFVEGIFELETGHPAWEHLRPLGIEPDSGELIVRREISIHGRSSVRLNGRTMPLRELTAIGPRLVEVNGQNQQLELLQPGAQRRYLDQFGNSRRLLAAYRRQLAALTQQKAELDRLGSDSDQRAREIDLLTYQTEEIAAAELEIDQDRAVLDGLETLSNQEQLSELASAALEQLTGSGGAGNRLAAVVGQLQRLGRLSAGQTHLAEQLLAAQEIADGIAAELAGYLDQLEDDPARLEELTVRMRLIDDLKYKYGPSIGDILASGEAAAERLLELSQADQKVGELGARIAESAQALSKLAAALSDRRRRAATALEAKVTQNLEQLGLARAQFKVRLEPIAESRSGGRAVGYSSSGADAVNFQLAANPGEPPRALGDVASGGEISRIMLALRCALLARRLPATVVFDEIDAGVGARRGMVLGFKLWQLGGQGQVICVTHLPQIPAFAGRHFLVAKSESKGRSQVAVQALDEPAARAEIAAMVGSAGAHDSVTEILHRARQLCREHTLPEPIEQVGMV